MHSRVIFSNPEDLKRKAAGRTGEHRGSTCVKASPALSSPSSYSIMHTAWAQQTVSYPGNAWPQLKGFLQFRQQIKHTFIYCANIPCRDRERNVDILQLYLAQGCNSTFLVKCLGKTPGCVRNKNKASRDSNHKAVLQDELLHWGQTQTQGCASHFPAPILVKAAIPPWGGSISTHRQTSRNSSHRFNSHQAMNLLENHRCCCTRNGWHHWKHHAQLWLLKMQHSDSHSQDGLHKQTLALGSSARPKPLGKARHKETRCAHWKHPLGLFRLRHLC